MYILQDFITSALVIDDKADEVAALIEHLEKQDIWTKHYTPEKIAQQTHPFNNRKLIFLDLYLDDSKKSVENISIIRKYFKTIIGDSYGTYGIILWTKHDNHYSEFCDKIFQKNNEFTHPLFVISLDKKEYLKKGNYDSVLNDLEVKLKEDISSSFFIEWNKSVKSGSDNTIWNLYNLFENNKDKDAYLESMLYKLAINYTGIPIDRAEGYDLQKDLIKSLMDTLQFEISNKYNNVEKLFTDEKKYKLELDEQKKPTLYSNLNSLLLLDTHNLSQETPIPGNIYEIKDKDSPLFITHIGKKTANIDLDSNDSYKTVKKRRICIEVTPPCDFSNNKKQAQSRIIGGIHLDYNENDKKYFEGERYYNYLYPVFIDGFDKPQRVIFDFYKFQTLNEEDLKNSNKYEIILKAKDKLFADILQKFASHTARLGIAILNPKY
ncbi:MAG: hypothetical protein R2800_08355 [Flavipsychrobacter sp.]